MANSKGKGKANAVPVVVAKASVKNATRNKQPKARSTAVAVAVEKRRKPTASSAPPPSPSSSPMPPPPRPLVKVGSKRKAVELDDGDGGQAVAKMPILSARVRSVPQDMVEARWGPLSEKSKDEIMNVIRAAERPVLMTFRKENRRAEAQGVLRGVIRKVGNSLSKIPVPPMGKDMCLNYEKLIDKSRAMEAILEPDLRQIAELEAEINREQKRLEKDEDYYEELKKNAVAQENIRRQKSRRVHPILRNAQPGHGLIDSAERINLSSAETSTAASPYDVNSDRQLYPLTVQLRQHLASMQGNSAPLGEVTEWIQRGRAAVDEVLFQRAGDQVYDWIMGVQR